MLAIGGARFGKLRDIIGYVVCNSLGQRMGPFNVIHRARSEKL